MCKRELSPINLSHQINRHPNMRLNMSKRVGQYCENKHINILQKLDINEDDSCLSDLEDEIWKTCQLQTTPTCQNVNSNLEVKSRANDIFEIRKEKKFSEPENSVCKNEKNKMDVDDIIYRVEEKISQNSNVISSPVRNACTPPSALPQQITLPLSLVTLTVPEQFSEFHKFSRFVESAQGDKQFQPLMNLNKEVGLETCHESRKASQVFMDVDDEVIDNMNEMKHIESELLLSNQMTSIKKEKSINSQCFEKQANNFSANSVFKSPKNYKIDPIQEQCSTFNSYNKPFIPKIKAKEKLKNLVPFLKDFKPKFLKKENIDKKILRKFRNYVKILCKLNPESMNNYEDKNFWKNFTTINLLPPMRYDDDYGIRIEFKSFNTKYLLWLFSKDGCAKLYEDFVNKLGDQILEDFVSSYDLINNLSEEGIIEKLKYYIYAVPDIYSKRGYLIEGTTADNFTTSNLTYVSKINSEELLASYLGADFNLSNINTFNLNNFGETTYPRCGKKITNGSRNYYEDYENLESYCNFADQSFDSIPSVE